jgi:hypothetical protein
VCLALCVLSVCCCLSVCLCCFDRVQPRFVRLSPVETSRSEPTAGVTDVRPSTADRIYYANAVWYSLMIADVVVRPPPSLRVRCQLLFSPRLRRLSVAHSSLPSRRQRAIPHRGAPTTDCRGVHLAPTTERRRCRPRWSSSRRRRLELAAGRRILFSSSRRPPIRRQRPPQSQTDERRRRTTEPGRREQRMQRTPATGQSSGRRSDVGTRFSNF